MYAQYFKRPFDLIISATLIVILTPILLLIILSLFVVNKGTPYFSQERPGHEEKPFLLIKFKTMTDETDEHGNLLPDHERITWFGSILRKTSLDELPQLFNVLTGNMSLIGPRPLLFKYLPLYNTDQKRRHEVKPGITGLAQVNGRNSISWKEKFTYDVYYIDNLSFRLDMKILFLTVKKVLKREGINQSKTRPMQPFTGNN